MALPSSAPGILITLSKVTAASGGAAPVARSYDGHPWEALAAAPLPLAVSGPADASARVVIPAVAGSEFILDLFNASSPLLDDVARPAARLLLQATFGPTRADLSGPLRSNMSLEAVREYVHQQMALPPSLLREYYRKRMNVRAHGLTTPLGRTRPACSAGSRWHPYAFTIEDAEQTMVMESTPSGAVRLIINNETRSECQERSEPHHRPTQPSPESPESPA